MNKGPSIVWPSVLKESTLDKSRSKFSHTIVTMLGRGQIMSNVYAYVPNSNKTENLEIWQEFISSKKILYFPHSCEANVFVYIVFILKIEDYQTTLYMTLYCLNMHFLFSVTSLEVYYPRYALPSHTFQRTIIIWRKQNKVK